MRLQRRPLTRPASQHLLLLVGERYQSSFDVRETCVSLHHGGPVKGSLQYDSALGCMGGFREALSWVPMMPKDASFSDSYISDRCCFSRQRCGIRNLFGLLMKFHLRECNQRLHHSLEMCNVVSLLLSLPIKHTSFNSAFVLNQYNTFIGNTSKFFTITH